MKNRKNGFVAGIIFILVALVIIGIIIYSSGRGEINQPLTKNDDSLASSTGSDPSISSVYPAMASIGGHIEIKGQYFSGFEGDKYAWIESESTGLKGVIYSDQSSTDSLIRFTLMSKYCTYDTSYSGLPCQSYLDITPGEYNIFVSPYGKTSNKVKFRVNAAPQTRIPKSITPPRSYIQTKYL